MNSPRVLVRRATKFLYRSVFNRHYLRERRQMRAMYRQLFGTGDLVFDIGAHRGLYAELFDALGARVVAVEANPRIAAEVETRVPRATVHALAIGSERGTAMLRLGADSEHSTVSDAWASAMPDRWRSTIEVPMDTLDSLMDRHGAPKFCKIDVEGNEHDVLLGLSNPLPALSFEFQCAAPEVAEAATRRLADLGEYEFTVLVVGRYELGPWVAGCDDVSAEISRLTAENPTAYGDVYARLRR